MRFRLAALAVGLAMAFGFTEMPAASAAAPAAYSWCYYGSYSCYHSAYAKAKYLQHCGYCVKIVHYHGSYCVYYH